MRLGVRSSARRLGVLAIVCVAFAAQPRPITDYIKSGWKTLTRSNRMLAVAAADPKFAPESDGRWPVYVAGGEDLARIETNLRKEVLAPDLRRIVIRNLPATGGAQGLLYLPYPYVVPGGRFNEMYGWDSFFIQVGLLRDGVTPLA